LQFDTENKKPKSKTLYLPELKKSSPPTIFEGIEKIDSTPLAKSEEEEEDGEVMV
jgi:hypothetical protein